MQAYYTVHLSVSIASYVLPLHCSSVRSGILACVLIDVARSLHLADI